MIDDAGCYLFCYTSTKKKLWYFTFSSIEVSKQHGRLLITYDVKFSHNMNLVSAWS